MPSRQIFEIIQRLTILEEKMEKHLSEGAGIKLALANLHTDVGWIKKALWTTAGACITAALSLVGGIILYFVNSKSFH